MSIAGMSVAGMSVAGRSKPSPYELLTRRYEFPLQGRVTLCDGEFLYSPNCARDVLPPPPKPDHNLTDNIFHNDGRFFDPQIFKPRWWTTAFGYLSFVPCFPPFDTRPFDALGSVVVDRLNRGYQLRPSIADRWQRLEIDMDTAIRLLGQQHGIASIKPFSPTSWGYRDYVGGLKLTRERARLSRDWMVIWMALLSYSIAFADTQHMETPPGSVFSVPDWFKTLTDAGIDQIWASDVALSSVANYKDVARVGLYVDLVDPEKNQPSVGWFCHYDVPVWYRWNVREVQALQTSGWLAIYAPPADLLQQAATIITRLPSPPREHVLTCKEFVEERKKRIKRIIKLESPQDQRRRRDREQNPATASAKVFQWVYDGVKFARKPVSKAFRATVLGEYGEAQRFYDPISNEWDLCEELGPPDDTGYDDDYMAGPIEPNVDSQPLPRPRSPSPLGLAEDNVVEDEPEIHQVSSILTDYYGFVEPPNVPPQVAPIAPGPRSLVLRTLGMAKEDDEIFNTRHGNTVVDFVSRLWSKAKPDPSCWDLSRDNPRALARLSNHLGCVRKVGDLFVFDFGRQGTVAWKIAVTTPADVLTICRMDPNDRDITIARSLFSRGIPFRTLHPLRPVPRPMSSPTNLLLPYRLSGYQFTKQDYQAYAHQRDRILAGPRGRAALLRGGFVWRLARQTMGIDEVLKGPSPDVLVHRNGFSIDQFWDDELTGVELDLICGVYRCFTGSGNQIALKSWWPLVRTYEKMGCGGNFGRWTTWREQDYQRRLEEIEQGEAQPLSVNKWADVLRGQKTARVMKEATADFANEFLRHVQDHGL